MTRFGKKKVLAALGIAILTVIVVSQGEEAQVAEVSSKKTLVEVGTPASLSGNQATEIIGTVSARTQADLQSEVGGRVTAVNVTLGQRVSAGQVIATLENAAAQASVLQAQGAYEGALASAAQSTVGVNEAQNNLTTAQNNVISTYKSAYNTNNSILTGTIDTFFANPLTANPGLRLNGRGYTSTLNAQRVALQTALPAWRDQSLAASTNSNLPALISEARTTTTNVLNMVDTFILILQTQGSQDRYSEAEIQTFLSNFNAARSTLSQTLSSLNDADSSLVAAIEAKKRADISGATGSVVSSADAQVKQALGSLRAAQASLAKTIIRTPIAGEVNSLTVKTGDFVGSFAPIAKIANNQGLEITAFVGLAERDLLTVGTELLVENAGTGTVTNISPAIDAATGKTEIRIAIDGAKLNNGDVVRVFLNQTTQETNKTIQLPLSAVKFDGSQAYVFEVVDTKLVAKNIELGDIRGDRVDVVSGIDATSEIVVDARGLASGTEVTVVTK